MKKLRLWWFYVFRVFRISFTDPGIRGISLINLSGFVLGSFAIMCVVATMNGFYETVHRAISAFAGDISVLSFQPVSDHEKRELKHLLESEYGEHAHVFDTGAVMLSARGQSHEGLLEGMDSFRELNISADLSRCLYENAEPSVVLGHPFEDKLGIRAGDIIKLYLILPEGLSVMHARVCGFSRVGFYEYDKQSVWISHKHLASYAGSLSVGVKIHLPNVSLPVLEQAATSLKQKLGSSFFSFTWYERNQNLFEAIATERKLVLWVIAFIVLVASFNLISHLYVHYHGRREVFHLLYVLGERRHTLTLLGLFQGGWIGFLGSTLGVLCACLSVVLTQGPLKIPIPTEIYNLSHLPLTFDGAVAIAVVLCSSVLAMIVSIIPALKTRELFTISELQG